MFNPVLICSQRLIGHPGYQERKFRAHFGISVAAATEIWSLVMVQHWALPIDVCHLLWALYFLKVYPTWDVVAGYFRIDAKTAKKYCEFVVFVVLPAVLPPVSNLSLSLWCE